MFQAFFPSIIRGNKFHSTVGCSKLCITTGYHKSTQLSGVEYEESNLMNKVKIRKELGEDVMNNVM